MARLSLILVCVATAAFAQPKPAPKVPTVAVPCAMKDVELRASGDAPVVCWDKDCMKLDLMRGEAAMIGKPPREKRWRIPQAEVKDAQVCLGTTCKPLGKKLAKAIADYKKDDNAQPWRLDATADLKAVMFGGGNVWSVPADRPLNIARPRGRDPLAPGILGSEAVGNLIVVWWSTCAGPCMHYSVVDSAGQQKSPFAAGGNIVFQLDAKRFVVMSEYGAINVHQLGTGKRLASIELGLGPARLDAIRADDTNIFVLDEKRLGLALHKVVLPDDNDGPRHAVEMMFLPRCAP